MQGYNKVPSICTLYHDLLSGLTDLDLNEWNASLLWHLTSAKSPHLYWHDLCPFLTPPGAGRSVYKYEILLLYARNPNTKIGWNLPTYMYMTLASPNQLKSCPIGVKIISTKSLVPNVTAYKVWANRSSGFGFIARTDGRTTGNTNFIQHLSVLI